MNYVCIMSLQKIHEQFVYSLSEIYDECEAENVWVLAFEKILCKKNRQNEYEKVLLNETQVEQFQNINQRLLKHEPIQYIIEECWFYDIPFYVDKNVLIPRPETEELVDWIIKENKPKPNLTILDVGTGSGCIPIILNIKIPPATVYSCDVSHQALQVAKKNAATHKTDINFLLIDFLDKKNWSSLADFDIIVSNPPYVPQRDKNEMRKNVLEYEPHRALFVENNEPLIFYDAIANFGLLKLKHKGLIYVEIHESLSEEVMHLFESKGYKTELRKDMQGKHRMVKAFRTD